MQSSIRPPVRPLQLPEFGQALTVGTLDVASQPRTEAGGPSAAADAAPAFVTVSYHGPRPEPY